VRVQINGCAVNAAQARMRCGRTARLWAPRGCARTAMRIAACSRCLARCPAPSPPTHRGGDARGRAACRSRSAAFPAPGAGFAVSGRISGLL